MSHPDDPSVPRPCPVPVSKLEPREKGRHCLECDTLVLDTALHTRAEFLAIVARGEKVCAHLRSDGAGRVRFSDSPLKRRLSVVALSAALAACGEDAARTTVAPPPLPPPEEAHEGWVGQVQPAPETGETRGEVAAPPPDPSAVAPPTAVDPSGVAPEDPPPSHTRRGRVAPPRRSSDDDELVGLVE